MSPSPQKPIENGYCGFEEAPNSTQNQIENGLAEDILNATQNEENATDGSDDDFAEYLWMENEEEFDKQVLQQLEEEELTEQCLQAMIEEERSMMAERMFINAVQNSDMSNNQDIMNMMNNIKLNLIDIENSTLNPLAAEFIPLSISMSHRE